MIQINDLKVRIPFESEKQAILQQLKKTTGINDISENEIVILKKSLDARKKPDLFYVYQIGVKTSNKVKQRLIRQKKGTNYNPVLYHFPEISSDKQLDMNENDRPVIIGTGPAGLFCGYFLALAGLRPILIERGYSLKQRQSAVEEFWKNGNLDLKCNVQFGEGGAGTFSDGKLQTQVKDKTGRIAKILKVFVEHGAPEEITYLNKPHIGTDVLANVISSMHQKMEELGATFRFNTTFLRPDYDKEKLTGVILKNNITEEESLLKTRVCVLCIGHSARDTFFELHKSNIDMCNKPFAMGFRVQHKQADIDLSQYGEGYESKHLPAADYKLTYNDPSRSIYSFCMCPGGYVVNASSEEGRLAINGMSYHGRDSENANSAIVMTITEEDYGYNLFDGLNYQRKVEEIAYQLGQGKIPVETYGDFKANKKDDFGLAGITPVMKGDYHLCDLRSVFGEKMNEDFIRGMEHFDNIIPGFGKEEVLLAAVESRTSSPVKIVRDENYESNVKGLYPCGEGAGYAGGITSAALDGLKVAEKIALRYN